MTNHTHPLLTQVLEDCQQKQLIKHNATIVVGLSGGPDSVALLSLLTHLKQEYNLRLIAAHLDHQWRESSSDDVLFCKQFAESLGNEFMSERAENIVVTRKTSSSQEEQGRILRRTFFEKCAQETNADTIALAHHADDQQETFFMRLIRGASIAGLAAMKPKQGMYIRPLLYRSKEELSAYLKDKGLTFLTDETNEDTAYLRNALRLSVLPALRACDSRFDTSFFKMLETVQETDAFLERITQHIFATVVVPSKNGTVIDTEKFLSVDSFLHERLLVTWLCKEKVPFTPSRSFFNEIIRYMKTSADTHTVHPGWQLQRINTLLSIKHL